MIPEGATSINEIVSVVQDNDIWRYYLGLWPVYCHGTNDQDGFRCICAQLLVSGACRQHELVKVFAQNRKRLNRAVVQLRDRGMASFFEKRVGRKGGTILTDEMLGRVQELLNAGLCRQAIARELKIGYSTLSKAIGDGRLLQPPRTTVPMGSTRSDRSREDVAVSGGIGVACTRTQERVAASFGLLNGVESKFESCVDVPDGGALCALPALLENGLFYQAEKLGEIEGYYSKEQILLVLVFMLLCRYRNVEQLQGVSPGEFGKLIGLDRIPEARCLREKIATLSGKTNADQWAAQMAKFWFEKYSDTTGFLYVDGHVKVYGGDNALPKRYVSRQRLCLGGISYYWVNDAIGQPFFVVEKQIDHGMLEALRTDIIPRLLEDIPNQPSAEDLASDPQLHRFIIVFDREGYSPAFFKELWDNHRIACMTYRKNKTDDWPEAEFEQVEARTPSGEPFNINLAERETTMGTGEQSIAVKEVRKRTETGKQTAIVTTARTLDARTLAPHMFARWGQENFFAYAMNHFAIDQLLAYGAEAFPDTETVVNPAWRTLDRQRRQLQGKQTATLVKLHKMDSEKGADPKDKRHAKWQIKKAEHLEELTDIDEQTEKIKEAIKEVKQHIPWNELPIEQSFKQLPPARRTLINTIGMICYRAETAMATLLMETKATLPQSRVLLQDLFNATADLKPDYQEKRLHIHLHTATTVRRNERIAHLLNHLNETCTIYPGTDLQMVFHGPDPASEKHIKGTVQFPADQEF